MYMVSVYFLIDWWENKIDSNMRSKLLPNSWKGEVQERHERLEKMYFEWLDLMSKQKKKATV